MAKKTKAASLSWDSFGPLAGYDPTVDAAGFRFDAERAGMAIAFFDECLVHIKGDLAGKPFVLEDWQKAVIANLFGWVDGKGYRRYREAMIYIPRKNGKSLLAAGIANYMFFADGEKGAEIYCAAAEAGQARLVWDVAKEQIRREPTLNGACRIYQHSIVIDSLASSFKPISADAGTKHGFNTHCAVVDELHVQKDPELVEVLLTSTGARKQPLITYLTTADYARESICNAKYDLATKVRDGLINDPRFLPVIYEASLEDDWTDPKVWAKANPNLGVSISEEYLTHECERAKESPAYENTFKRLHLNIRTESDVKWINTVLWDEGGEAFDPAELEGAACFAGLDLASTTDLSAFVLYFPDTGRVLTHCWVPGDNARKREKRDRVPYSTWSRDGHIEMTPGNVADYDLIRERIRELGERYNIQTIAVDRWNSQQLQTQLDGDGFDVMPFGQGFASMSGPTKELEKLIIGRELQHGGHPVLRWAASNVSVETDAAGNLKPSKKKSTERIDPIVALIMAIGGALLKPEQPGSIYETRGILSL